MKAAVVPPPAIGPHQWYYVKTEFKDTDPVAARPGIRNPARTWLRSLPTNPYQLLEILYAQSAYLGSDRNVNAFSAIGRLLSSPA